MANKRISELTSASALTLSDLLALVNEAQTKKVTISTLLSFIAAQEQFATLDSNGKIPLTQIPDSIRGALHYQTTWDAFLNSPAIPTASATNLGWYFVVGTAGETMVNGVNDWKVGDWIISNGEAWQKIDNTDAVLSWNNRKGSVVPVSGDYTTDQVTEAVNKYFTEARALAALLAGLNTSTTTAITSADSVLSALGKLQGQVALREIAANKGTSGGYASLDDTGKIPLEQIPPSLLGAANYQGTWNGTGAIPATGTATSGNKGFYYVLSTDVATIIDGTGGWKLGDWIISNGTVWQKVDNTDALLSWNGRTGAVTPQSGDYTTSLVTEGTNKYYTAARVLAEVLAGFSTTNSAITASDPILTAFGKAQGQISARELLSNRGIASGYAALDTNARVPKAQLPKGQVSLALDFAGYAVGSVTSEVVMNSKQIVTGTLAAGDQLNISTWLGLNNGGSAKTFRVYLSTLAGTVGAAVPGGTTLIGTYTATTNAASVKFEREVSFLSNTTMKAGVAAATSSLKGDNTSTLDSAITIPSLSSTFYVIITGQKVTAGDTLRLERLALTAFLQ
jgi:hypothetical protein